MSIGNSGRIVIEIDPNFKKQLYSALKIEGVSLKAWFLENAEHLLAQKSQQQPLPLDSKEQKVEAQR